MPWWLKVIQALLPIIAQALTHAGTPTPAMVAHKANRNRVATDLRSVADMVEAGE